jgi:hypothetical protein
MSRRRCRTRLQHGLAPRVEQPMAACPLFRRPQTRASPSRIHACCSVRGHSTLLLRRLQEHESAIQCGKRVYSGP